MRSVYVVTYDISDPGRLRRVAAVLLGYGDRLQLSVFRCELSRLERIELQARLESVIHHREDQVLFVQLGPVDGRGDRSLATIGRALTVQERSAIVV